MTCLQTDLIDLKEKVEEIIDVEVDAIASAAGRIGARNRRARGDFDFGLDNELIACSRELLLITFGSRP